ncbi:hypothetical protein SBRY_50802 [Actinacidiphila bryophytorum]|uniref:Uncharacterized protein n=1 Tax=Actinacidiphila bryophytorum TaxID=1436133 RepID=A0A9W4MJP4_9ACTN|nr:hypothetical protein SBRY_50802 [Actinacidiphila bryophytorum]
MGYGRRPRPDRAAGGLRGGLRRDAGRRRGHADRLRRQDAAGRPARKAAGGGGGRAAGRTDRRGLLPLGAAAQPRQPQGRGLRDVLPAAVRTGGRTAAAGDDRARGAVGGLRGRLLRAVRVVRRPAAARDLAGGRTQAARTGLGRRPAAARGPDGRRGLTSERLEWPAEVRGRPRKA